MAECIYLMVIPDLKEKLDGYAVEREIVKIGWLRRFRDLGDLERRRATLSAPSDWGVFFGVRYALWMPDGIGKRAEGLLHHAFDSRKVLIEHPRGKVGQEFFDLDPEEAKSAFQLLLIQGASEIYDAEDYIEMVEDWDDDEGSVNEDPAGFLRRSDIPIGAKLTFVSDPTETCIVTAQNPLRVKYGRNNRLSLTALTKRLTGFISVSGPLYWMYNGVRVSELPNR